MRVNTQLRKAPYSALESFGSLGSILTLYDALNASGGLYFHLRKEVWAMSIEGYMLAMELPLLLFLYYIYIYK